MCVCYGSSRNLIILYAYVLTLQATKTVHGLYFLENIPCIIKNKVSRAFY